MGVGKIIVTTFSAFAFMLVGCSTTYQFVTQPDGVSVYHQKDGTKALLGTTPLEFKKSALPENAPFTVMFEKSGYEPLNLVITPTDNSHTTVTATMKPGSGNGNDPESIRVRSVLNRVFKVQEHVATRRYAEALSLLRDLEKDEPNLAETYVLKGSVYLMLNDSTQARSAWEKALSLDPSLDDVRVQLNKIATDTKVGAKP
jgi:tetratricopeptide (TPR) repeat protein